MEKWPWRGISQQGVRNLNCLNLHLQVFIFREEILEAISITEVAEIMVLPEVFEQLFIIYKPRGAGAIAGAGVR